MKTCVEEPVAVVTGASKGIGRATALALAAAGCHVMINYRSDDVRAKEVATEVEARGVRAALYPADVGDAEAVRAMFLDIRREFGRVDVTVNNAGMTKDGLFLLMSSEKWESVLNTNLTGTFNVARESLRLMARQRRGSIVNVSSVSGVAGMAGQVNYSAAKGGIIAFTKALAREAAGFGVRVNAVAPGLVQTGMLDTIPKSMLDLYVEAIPLKRIGQPEEVASTIAFLASDLASYITGQVITIDGGMVMQ